MADKLEDVGFEELAREFQQVLSNISQVGDKGLERFREEYEKIYVALRKSHDNELRLIKKVRELNNEIVGNATKVATALKLSEEDGATIEELKRQVDKAWSMVEAANARDDQARTTLDHVQADLQHALQQLQHHADLVGGDTTIEEIVSQRDSLQQALRAAEAALAHERSRNEQLVAEVAVRQEKHIEKKGQIKELERQLAAKSADEAREQKKRVGLEADMVKLREQLALRIAAVDSAKKAQEEAAEKALKIEKQLVQQRAATADCVADLHKQNTQNTKLLEQLREGFAKAEALKDTVARLQRELKAAADDLARERLNSQRLQVRLDVDGADKEKALKAAEEERFEATKLKAQLAGLQKDLDAEILRARGAERVAQRLDREKSSADKAVAMEQSRVAEHRDMLGEKAAELAALEAENRRLLTEATKMRTVISVLERDREKIRQQLEDMEQRLRQSADAARAREEEFATAERHALELAARLKSSQSMYETVRAERNAATKLLKETKDLMAELGHKSRLQSTQIEQMKEDIGSKDRALIAEQCEHQSVEKRLEQKAHEVDQLKRLLDEANVNVTKQDNEIAELNATIQRLDAEALAQKRAYDQVVTERDILGTQLIRRNDELALLYEKLAIHASTLAKGEAQYKERLEDIRLLRIKVADLRRELSISTTAAGATAELRREVARLQREHLQEQTKVKALSEELENPMNVHRWRKLEGSDPATYEMIQKIQTLQRRLISKTEEVVEKDLLLAERDKMHAELQAMLARQPGPEVAEQVAQYQALLNERTRQLKALASELNMQQAQLSEYKGEVDRVTREMLETKKQFYEATRKRAGERRGSASGGGSEADAGSGDATVTFAARAAEAQRAAAQVSAPRFVGGGFNVHAA